MVLRERFARNIKYQREKRRWTQETAAEICDLSPRYWGKLERGDAAASIDTMEKVSKGMKISIEELLKEEYCDEENR
ncbi:transcriptional regulator, XRE family [Oscillibacter sp. PC13]|uniref:helix-turn-helix domain-containing protein n=1 Tax=Oscillibacter sp. PC13 TaxID=1855299 RepID=UPI0008DEDC1B|nr:helix-turn-helix transcriptional regulator [Oscillibacter sp. PC13]SFP77682.1 transcriptional regulator, XRE family [Oscillibacter sp. PC13]